MSCLSSLKGNRLDIVCCVKLQDREEVKKDSFLFLFFKKIYAPFLLKDWVRPFVVSHSSHAEFLHIDAAFLVIKAASSLPRWPCLWGCSPSVSL